MLVLDRADFPRDKVCGDGIAPEALDVLAGLGIDPAALTAGYPAVPRLRLRSPGGATVERAMHRPASVVPRAVFDDRLLDRGAGLGRGVPPARRPPARRPPDARRGRRRADAPAVVVGADGAESVVRRVAGHRAEPRRPDWRSRSAATPRSRPGRTASRSILTTEQRWPAYAWSFPLGDGRANVGYGELVSGGVTRGGAAGRARSGCCPASRPDGLKAHRLPLSTGRPRQPDGRVLLAGDAASLINPLTGEGIFYAVLSGRAGRRGGGGRRRRGRGLPAGAAAAARPAPAALVDGVAGPAAGRG